MWRDACSRRVVGWHLAAQMPTKLVLTSLEQALTLRQPVPGLLIHADCGSQYTSMHAANASKTPGRWPAMPG